jgi:O-antigen/teichoic acid export membrane protein
VACFVVRGGLSGRGRLYRYGALLSIEGGFRLVALVGLAAFGVRSVTAYGWLFGLAPWVAVGASVVGLRRHALAGRETTGPAAPLLAPLSLLLVSTLCAQLLIGAGPITGQLFAGSQQTAAAGAFLAALVVVRVPVFLFTAVQPSMLPAMAAHVAAGRVGAFRSLLGKVLAGMGLLAAVVTLVTTAVGPWGLRLLFGPGFDLSWQTFFLTSLSVALFMTASVLGQAVLALGHHRLVALGWLVGLSGLAVGISLASDLVGRATLGLLIGAGAAMLTFAGLVVRSMRRWHPAADPALAPTT